MIPLAVSIAIPDEHTRLTHLETGASFLAAIGAAMGHHNNNCRQYSSSDDGVAEECYTGLIT
jgi:hypothetical protein